MAKGHARLPPSSAHRWMNCAGSIQLIGDDSSTSNQAAMRGTAAHKVVETMIINDEHDARKYFNRSIIVKGIGDEEAVILPPNTGAPIKAGWFLFICDDQMCDGVQLAIDECDRLREAMFHPEVFTERYLDMSWLDPRLGGTADYTLVEPFGWAHLIDYKNGYITVEHIDNEQCMTYAVGILREHPDAEGVRVTIVQPNAFHEEGTVRTVEYTRDELKLFEIRLREAAKATAIPNAQRRAGDWCLWCPAQLRCPEFEAMQMEQARMDFADEPDAPLPVPTDNRELAEKARWIPLFDQWARNINAAVQAELMSGNAVGTLKLVRGKSNRKWRDPDEAVQYLQDPDGLGLGEEIFTAPKLKSPAQIEKLGEGKVQRAAVKALVKVQAFKPEGRLTVADANDPRPAVDPATIAAEDFAEEPEEIEAWE